MPVLRDPLNNSNWVWVLGATLIVVAAAVLISLWIAYARSTVAAPFKVRSLTAVQRARYHAKVDEVSQLYLGGEIDDRDAHLALAALIRACATERTGVDFESLTAKETAVEAEQWPLLSDALQWCVLGSFPSQTEATRLPQGFQFARQVVDS